MEPNTNEATAPKRLKTGGKKPIIIIGVIVAVLLAAYVGLCAYANSLDIFYPNTTINGVDVAGLTAEQAAERLRQEGRSVRCERETGQNCPMRCRKKVRYTDGIALEEVLA